MPSDMLQIPIDATETDAEERLLALDGLRELRGTNHDWESQLSAATMVLVDALLEADAGVLGSATDPLRDALAFMFEDEGDAREVRGWLRGLLSLTRWGLLRLPSSDEVEIARDSQAWQFLDALALGQPRNSGYLKDRLGTGDSQISRVGRRLLAQGLVIQRRLGRQARWELTPRGRQLVRATGDQPVLAADAHTDGTPTRPTSMPATSTTRRVAVGETTSARAVSGAGRPGHRTSKKVTAAVMYRGVGAPSTTKPKAERLVIADPDGGWRVVKDSSGRAIERHTTKADAIARAKEIVGRAGGGVVLPHDRSGAPGKPLSVMSQTAHK